MWKDGGPAWGTSVNGALHYTRGITGDPLSPHASIGHLRISLMGKLPICPPEEEAGRRHPELAEAAVLPIVPARLRRRGGQASPCPHRPPARPPESPAGCFA